MTRRISSICYKMFVCLSLMLGIFFNLNQTTSRKALLSYYTLQNNIICLIAFLIFLVFEIIKKQYKNDMYYLLKGALVVAIAITAIIYHIALAPGGFEMDRLIKSINNKVLANFLVHTFSPILVILDYVIFDEKGHLKFFYPFIWLIQPLNYVVYVYTYSSLGGTFYGIGGSKQFAYFFLDYTKLGYTGVVKWLIAIGVAIFVIAEILVFVDKSLAKLKKMC